MAEKRAIFTSREQSDLAENLTLLASMVTFASKGLNLSKQELLTQIHGKLIDLREMVYQNETVASIEIKLDYQE